MVCAYKEELGRGGGGGLEPLGESAIVPEGGLGRDPSPLEPQIKQDKLNKAGQAIARGEGNQFQRRDF